MKSVALFFPEIVVLLFWLLISPVAVTTEPLENYSQSPADQADQEKANRLRAEGDQAWQTAKFKEAQAKYEEALQAYEAIRDKRGIADCWHKLAIVKRVMGRFDEAAEFFERALKQHNELEDRKAAGNDLRALAEVALSRGNYSKSLEISDRVVKICEELGDKRGTWQILNIRSVAYRHTGQYKEALECGEKGFKVAEDLNDKVGMAAGLNNIGTVHLSIGNYREALEFFQKSFTIKEELGDKRGYLILHNIGNVHSLQGNYSKALEYHHEVLKKAEETGEEPAVARSLSQIGLVTEKMGNHIGALEYYWNALKMSKRMGDKGGVVEAFQRIAGVYSNLGNYRAALEYRQENLKLIEQIGTKPQLAQTLHNIGVEYRKLGDDTEALNYFRKSLELFEQIGKQTWVASGFFSNGFTHYRRKEMKEAERYLTEAIRISRQIGDPENLWSALHIKGLMFEELGRTDEALGLLKEAIRIIENLRGQIELTEARAGYLQEKLEVYDHLIQLLVRLGKNQEAFNYTERAKARAFLDLLAEAKGDIRKKINSELLARERFALAKWLTLQRRFQEAASGEKTSMSAITDTPIAERSGLRKDDNQIEPLQEQLTRAEREYENLKLEIRRLSPEYAALQYPEPITLEQAQRLLDDRQVLLEYVLGAERSFLFAVTATDFGVYPLPGSASLEKHIAPFSQLLGQPPTGSGTARYKVEAYRLYELLLKPAEKQLAGKQSLLIVPDGALALLPFPALLTKKVSPSGGLLDKTMPYLVTSYVVRYIPSASVLAQLRRAEPPSWPKQLVAFAPVTFDERVEIPDSGKADTATIAALYRGAVRLGSLSYTKRELEWLKALYPAGATTLYLENEATKAKVQQGGLEQYRYVHFATHGIINTERPEFSSILLRPSGGDDGYLQLAEIFNLDLNAELVTLSACQTGRGKTLKGEGLIGMSRGFMYAGARSVLASLWNVRDQSTAYLMKEFYKHLNQSTPAQALRQAQLEFIRGEKKELADYRHPYYWSAFILVGER